MLALKLFREYFLENEKKWFSILNSFFLLMERFKIENEFLSAQYLKSEKDDISKIIKNYELSLENLLQHKHLLNKLIGLLNREQTDRINILNKKNLQLKEFSSYIKNWEIIRKSPILKAILIRRD